MPVQTHFSIQHKKFINPVRGLAQEPTKKTWICFLHLHTDTRGPVVQSQKEDPLGLDLRLMDQIKQHLRDFTRSREIQKL